LTKPSASKKAAPREVASPAPTAGAGVIDAAIIAMLLTLALFMMARSGLRRGTELMPWPDGLEYAAVAVNLDRGLGPVLHFGGYSYPSRYTEGYPLILAAAYPILRRHVERLCLAAIAMGLLAIALLYILTFMMFGRASAVLSCLILALCPVFITYSTMLLSDVPTLAVTILAALAFYYVADADDAGSLVPWVFLAGLFGLIAGFTVMIRPTNATILAAIAAAMLLVRSRRRLAEMVPGAISFAAGFAIFPIWQAVINNRYLGGPLRSGYEFWVPEVYGSFGKTFGARFLFGPTLPGNPHGNAIWYLLTLGGLDGLLGDPGDPRFVLYPFAAAIFAIIGVLAAIKIANRPALRVICFGLTFLATLLLLYLFYFFTDIAFLMPATFVVFAVIGFGILSANRVMIEARSRASKTYRDLAVIGWVILLDVILALSLATETISRISTSPPQSKMVAMLLSIRPHLKPEPIVISNISLQFLELYLAQPKAEMIGLNPFDPGGKFTDYHLARLYAKKSAGWVGPVPAVLFPGQHIDSDEAKKLSDSARAGRPLYLLMTAPERQDYADLLKDELGELSGAFALEPIATWDLLQLYRLTPR
jgi:4-amino-4-deoxy-L-arabinose transferase-like glycosyltransferase